MPEFKKVIELLEEDYPELDICSNNGTPVHVVQWQPQGVISLSNDRGVKCLEPIFITKAINFLKLAKEKKSGLVLTPEYSMPYKALEELVSDKSKWPEKGKLWCLGTQGESLALFNEIIHRWNTCEDVIVIDYAMNNIAVEAFVCPLFYIFITQDNKLCVIPQLKTVAMADPRLFFEGPSLCRGNTIFLFESKNPECQNGFLSLICADSIGISSIEIWQGVLKKCLVIFNPQLNLDPRYDTMHRLRKDLITKKFHEVRILTLNWSVDTGIQATNIKFKKPWSAFYKRKSDKNLFDCTFRANVEDNHKKGTGYTLDGHIEIWYSKRQEHCKVFLIRKGDHGNLAPALVTGDEPKTENCFIFNEADTWVEDEDGCMSDINQLYLDHRVPPTFPYPVCSKNAQTSSCDKCQKCDHFYGTMLGHFEEGEISSKSELVTRVLVGTDYESDNERAKKLELIVELKRTLDSGNIPRLEYFINNYEFFVHNDFPNLGKRIVNLKPIRRNDNPYPEALVLITDKKREEEIEEMLDDLKDKVSSDYRNQILIYYKPITGHQFTCYYKHLDRTEIVNPSFSDNLSSIRNPQII